MGRAAGHRGVLLPRPHRVSVLLSGWAARVGRQAGWWVWAWAWGVEGWGPGRGSLKPAAVMTAPCDTSVIVLHAAGVFLLGPRVSVYTSPFIIRMP